MGSVASLTCEGFQYSLRVYTSGLKQSWDSSLFPWVRTDRRIESVAIMGC